MRKKGKLLLLLTLLLVGIGIVTYPAFSDYINRRSGSYAAMQASQAAARQEPEDLAAQRQLAERYNGSLTDPERICEDYASILDFGDGIMAQLRIPAIGVKLPVYHGVEESVLEKGVGHLPSSAFPIGGEGNHSVLTGHTGLPSAQLFTELTALAEGDLFYIDVLRQTLAYRVDQILVVLPEDTAPLQPEPGQDYCTLVTCTPYGINSHRLLVRGIRTEISPAQEAALQEAQTNPSVPVPVSLMVAGAGAVLTVAAMVFVAVRKRKE